MERREVLVAFTDGSEAMNADDVERGEERRTAALQFNLKRVAL
jgi:hypothetical protein